jgi:hypothetical protein
MHAYLIGARDILQWEINFLQFLEKPNIQKVRPDKFEAEIRTITRYDIKDVKLENALVFS